MNYPHSTASTTIPGIPEMPILAICHPSNQELQPIHLSNKDLEPTLTRETIRVSITAQYEMNRSGKKDPDWANTTKKMSVSKIPEKISIWMKTSWFLKYLIEKIGINPISKTKIQDPPDRDMNNPFRRQLATSQPTPSKCVIATMNPPRKYITNLNPNQILTLLSKKYQRNSYSRR